MNQTLKVSFGISRHVKRDGFARQDDGQREKPLGSRMVMSASFDSVQARLASLRELQSATGEELRPLFGRTLLPSVLRSHEVPSEASRAERVGVAQRSGREGRLRENYDGECYSEERIPAMLTISQVQSEDQISAVQELLREYISWWAEVEPEDFAQAPTFLDWEKEITTLPGIYIPPAGRLLLAMQDGQPAGCVFLKGHDPTTAELKRLYVRPAFRGQNIGWQLVKRLVDQARQSGYQRIVLDTHTSMKKAMAMYQAVGFRVVSTPDDVPDTLKPFVVYMEYNLPVNQ